MDKEANRDHIQSIERCMSVIEAFTDQPGSMSISDLASTTKLSKPAVRRILLTLVSLGFARSEGTRFTLTPKILSLGYAYLSSLNLSSVAQPFMESLTDRVKTSVVLSALDDVEVVYINRVHRHRIRSLNLAVGTRLPAYATSSGHVLLADLQSDALNEYFGKVELAGLTDRTLTSKSRLVERLQVVRKRGWDIVDQELEIGRVSASAPVIDTNGSAIAALSLSCDSVEHSAAEIERDFLPDLIDAASSISAEIGGSSYAQRV